MSTLSIILLVVGIVALFFKFGGIINEICYSYALYKAAKSTGDSQALISFVPVLRYFEFGRFLETNSIFASNTNNIIISALLGLCVVKIVARFFLPSWIISLTYQVMTVLRIVTVGFVVLKKSGRLSLINIVTLLLGYDGLLLLACVDGI